MNDVQLKWYEGWIKTWQLYRMMKLSCKLDYHIKASGKCQCEWLAIPEYSPLSDKE